MPEITPFQLNQMGSCTIIFGSLQDIDKEIGAYILVEHIAFINQ